MTAHLRDEFEDDPLQDDNRRTKRVQQFDPPGIFARTPKNVCLFN